MNGGTINIQSCGDDGIQVDAEDAANPEEDGHVLIKGGTLTINGSAAGTKCIKAEGNIDIEGGTLTLKHTGIPVWDSDKSKIKEATGMGTDRNLTINGDAAVVNITMTGNGARGMKCDSTMTCTAGTIDINCSGADWAYSNVDTSSVRCAKADYAFILNGANLKVTTTKDEAIGVYSEATALISGGTLTLNTYDHGIKSLGNMDITGGTINYTITGPASKAVKCEGDLHITGGNISGTVSGGGETASDQTTAASAGLKCDGNMVIDGGTFDLKATGAGDKGINVDGTLTINDGNITVSTTGGRYGTTSSSGGGFWPGGGQDNSDTHSSPKAIRCEGNMTINGGTIKVTTTGGVSGSTGGGPGQNETGAEGLESKGTMTINGGYIEATTYDDALNCASHMYLKGGYIYAVATGNDAIDSNGNMYISGGYIMCCGSEEGFDANSEGGYKVYIQNGACFMAVGRTMGAIESGANISQTCYQGTYTSNNWHALYSGNTVAFAALMPTISGGGGGGPGGGSSSAKVVVTAPSTPKLYKSVTASGTTFWSGKGATSATGGSQVTLSTYSSGGGW